MKYLSTILLLLPFLSVAQPNIDSLWGVWEDEKLADTARLKAINVIAKKVYLKSNLDSAIYCAGLQLEFAEQKEHHKFTSYALTTLGNAYHHKRDLEQALSYYQQGLEFNTKVNNQSGAALALNNIGVVYINKSDYEKAFSYFEKSLDIKKEIGNEKAIAKALNNLGYVCKLKGDYRKALQYYEKSLDIKKKINDKKGIAVSLNFMATVYENQGDIAKAIEFYTKSLKTYEETNNESLEMGTHHSIGTLYEEQGDFQKALEHYQKSIEISKKIQNDYYYAFSLKSKGDIYAKLNKYDSAFYFINISKQYFENIDDVNGVSTTFQSLGLIHQLKGEYNKAIEYYTEALKIDEEIGDKVGIVIALNSIGNIYYEQGELIKAMPKIEKSLSIAQEIGLLLEIRNASKLLYEINKKNGNYKQGLEMLELYVESKDSIDSEENHKEIIRQEYKYEYEKQAAADSVKAAEAAKVKDAQLSAEQAENKRHQIEAKQQREQKYFLYGGLSLALIFGGFIFNRFRVTRKQKGLIEQQKHQVDLAYEQLGEKNKEIVDSINYAKRIQSAIMPPINSVKKILPDSFILYKPKDIVAGDFYWMEQTEDSVLIAAADCTGHGVPGAMVSVVCNNGLNRSVREHRLTKPAKILDKTREIVISEFEKSEEEVKDGMDIALCALHSPSHSQSVLQYAGAHNPLWIICTKERHHELAQSLLKGSEGVSGKTNQNQFSVFEDSESENVLIELKADKQPIGKYGAEQPFTNHTIALQKGDSIYIFSDGFADQFGGEKGKKFKTKNLKKLLLSIQNETMDRQKVLLDESFEEWKGVMEQLDDVCVIGVRI